LCGVEEYEEKGEEDSSKHIKSEMGLKKSIENFCSPHPLYPLYPLSSQRIFHVKKKYNNHNNKNKIPCKEQVRNK
jgi:hypothetical protein